MNALPWWVFLIVFGVPCVCLGIIGLCVAARDRREAEYYGMMARFIDREARL